MRRAAIGNVSVAELVTPNASSQPISNPLCRDSKGVTPRRLRNTSERLSFEDLSTSVIVIPDQLTARRIGQGSVQTSVTVFGDVHMPENALRLPLLVALVRTMLFQ